MKWLATAPSNIALIKYMGRKDEEAKIPANASLSYTLPHLESFVELEISSEKSSRWEPLTHKNSMPLILSSKAQNRFLNHLDYILNYFSCQQTFVVRSCNNFPQASGLASSASSFAALTRVAVAAICDLKNHPPVSLETLTALSRRGSGSSCRSFYEPWALWNNEIVSSVDISESYRHFIHQAVIISDVEKAISSSKAHQLVTTSPFYDGRANRAESRLNQLITILKNNFNSNDWAEAYQITWDEFQDMHQLFETSSPVFSYRNETSYTILEKLRKFWEKQGDGPLITMDAGPNIHLLYRTDQTEIANKIQHDFLKNLKVLS